MKNILFCWPGKFEYVEVRVIDQWQREKVL